MTGGKAKKAISSATFTNCGPRDLPSRTISFNANGSHLAIGTSSAAIHIWDPSKEPKEVSLLSGHSAPVTKVRYHPVETSSLVSASNNDSTVRLWDTRSPPRSNSVGTVECRTRPLTAEWNPVQLHAFLVLEKNGDVKVFDKRKLQSITAKDRAATPLHSKAMDKGLPESCLFDPTGDFLVAGTTPVDGVAPLQVWNWRDEGDPKIHSFPAHTGMILSMAFSHDGRKLLTGGHDAMVGIWNVEAMCCTHAVSKHARYVLSTSFAPDDTLFATSTYDECFVAETLTGHVVGEIPFSKRPRSGGAEEIAFHPVTPHLLACAKSEPKPVSSVSLVKMTVS